MQKTKNSECSAVGEGAETKSLKFNLKWQKTEKVSNLIH